MSIVTKWNGFRALLHFDNRWQLIFNRIFFGANLDVYVYKEMRILMDREGGDACGTRMCLVSNMYKKYLRSMKVTNNISVLDLGANGGGFALMLKAEGIVINKLVCVEMNPNTWQRLEYNIKSNFDCKTFCLNRAMSDKAGEIELLLGKGGTGDSLFSSDCHSIGSKIYRIPIMTFDVVYKEFFDKEVVDICKIDIEGAEYGLFLNGDHALIRCCRYLIIEVHNNGAISRYALEQEFRKMGFREISADRSDAASVHLFENEHIA